MAMNHPRQPVLLLNKPHCARPHSRLPWIVNYRARCASNVTGAASSQLKVVEVAFIAVSRKPSFGTIGRGGWASCNQ